MFSTTHLTDKITLFITCLLIYLVQPVFEIEVVPIILVIIFTCFISYLENQTSKILLNLGYFFSCFLNPSMLIFLPLFLYDLFLQKSQPLMLLAIIPIYVGWSEYHLLLIGTILSLSLTSIWLKRRTVLYIETKSKQETLSDINRQLQAQFIQQKKDHIEKMDTDVNLATLQERNRIAREIHDNVGHQLSSAILQLGALLAINRDESLKTPLSIVTNTLSSAMTSIRDSVHDLHDKSIDLHGQIEALVVNFTFCEIQFDDDLTSSPDTKVKLAFISIVKEALSNIIKHSNATQVNLMLREHPAFYQLLIKDNGTVKMKQTDSGMGLTNMSDRVQVLSGNIHIQNATGFEIFISVPKGGIT